MTFYLTEIQTVIIYAIFGIVFAFQLIVLNFIFKPKCGGATRQPVNRQSKRANIMKKLFLFHVGRGGRFHNAGHTTFKDIIERFDADYYGINTYCTFEDLQDVIDSFEDETGCNLIEVLERHDVYVNELVEMTKEQADKELKSIFTAENITTTLSIEDFGDRVIVDGGGDVIMDYEAPDSESGSCNIDEDYNTYYWKPYNELDEKELELFLKEAPEYEIYHTLIDCGLDYDLLTFLDKENLFRESMEYLFYEMPIDKIAEFEEIEIFDNEQDADLYSAKNNDAEILELNGKYYV